MEGGIQRLLGDKATGPGSTKHPQLQTAENTELLDEK